MCPDVHSSIVLSGQDMETTKVSNNRWLDKEDVVHRYNGILLSYMKRWNTAICDNIGLEIIMLSKISQTGKVKPYDFTHVWYKTESNKLTRQTKTYGHRRQFSGCERRGRYG